MPAREHGRLAWGEASLSWARGCGLGQREGSGARLGNGRPPLRELHDVVGGGRDQDLDAQLVLAAAPRAPQSVGVAAVTLRNESPGNEEVLADC